MQAGKGCKALDRLPGNNEPPRLGKRRSLGLRGLGLEGKVWGSMRPQDPTNFQAWQHEVNWSRLLNARKQGLPNLYIDT